MNRVRLAASAAAFQLADDLDAVARRIDREGPLLVEVSDTTGALQRAYARARRRYSMAIRGILASVVDGAEPMYAANRFERAYEAAARAAYDAGISAGGAPARADAGARAWLQAEVDRETSRFAGFAGAVARDEVDFPGGAAARAELYVGHLDGVANQGFVDARAGERTIWWWRLGDADHCDDCVTLALAGPYRERPPTVPRAGGTVCVGNCKCELVAETLRGEEASA